MAEDNDPAGRVARVSFLRGPVYVQTADDDSRSEATINRPLATGAEFRSTPETRQDFSRHDFTGRDDLNHGDSVRSETPGNEVRNNRNAPALDDRPNAANRSRGRDNQGGVNGDRNRYYPNDHCHDNQNRANIDNNDAARTELRNSARDRLNREPHIRNPPSPRMPGHYEQEQPRNDDGDGRERE